MKSLVIIPTFNERENITNILNAILALKIADLHILVVDDNSPDGTADLVEAMTRLHSQVHLLQRDEKLGLGTAYVAGFRYALQHGYERIIEMDADFSHDPNDLPKLLDASRKFDVVIGSRYCKGVNVVNWPLRRLLLSMGASFYTRVVTGLPVHDCTAGFVCYRREVLEAINLDRVQSDGYSFQIEMKFKAWKKGFKIGEVPIVFIDRRMGQSKMSKRIVHEAYWMVWKLKFQSLFGRLK
ncbi:polyprenol monophosphomannose synthase [candidate division KSB1 bacterium]|nr:polyprenol monophosphomannose synthase [candidate division KSB1 bacterium]RQW05514.1 MAG: polyprenol monophosphomannose synthase [candidate division KSB1 bacterium]